MQHIWDILKERHTVRFTLFYHVPRQGLKDNSMRTTLCVLVLSITSFQFSNSVSLPLQTGVIFIVVSDVIRS